MPVYTDADRSASRPAYSASLLQAAAALYGADAAATLAVVPPGKGPAPKSRGTFRE
ncbi:MAG TPA: hypothetical protein VJM09_04370 [Sphingobium sp.]|nr:hypothetical protein [Sphingobium sp.]